MCVRRGSIKDAIQRVIDHPDKRRHLKSTGAEEKFWFSSTSSSSSHDDTFMKTWPGTPIIQYLRLMAQLI